MSEVIVKMNKSDLGLLIAAGIAFTVWYKLTDHPSELDKAEKNLDKNFTGYQPPKAAYPYLTYINEATRVYNLPPKLLGRLLDQESGFRPDVISGAVKSPAGAVGIAQIVPKWHPDVNPLDPVASIMYAGKFLADLYRQYGNWSDALAAYNWGSGNLNKFKRGELSVMPKETINYVAKITKDVGVA